MSAKDKKSALLGQMSCDAYALLSDGAQAELRMQFNALNDELQELIPEERP
ncbi:hypothetical protein [Paraburkholderia sp. RL17-337-BIB-A]|uniref:hypothetical protein n=1 Tax=Paraburkholderia sp. RL17-337-BIB-A TaxID=3031636 RepID=UPI0038BC34CC